MLKFHECSATSHGPSSGSKADGGVHVILDASEDQDDEDVLLRGALCVIVVQ